MPRLSCLRPRVAILDTRTAWPPARAADAELTTPEHRSWRAAVLRRAGYRCEEPDCGRTGVRLFADHIVEGRDGGAPLDPANGQCLCGSRHSRKRAAVGATRMRA
ncbi:HNH endonuclease signature motif containing protein [Methylobacterium platani]|uniref:HNH endonuclease n=2 Tax=Methylobacterium platani TaxID=427683 RepID=A0A179SC93_9HYPH|nr:HNH endonuclease signature motif containing protein [Methylobacterium platani]KMO19532.1 HNH endonuclease [Methylobacterium platani JCM 14648]OAS24020.1 HNH endonuclease [Methylobacterium platani]